MAVNVFKEKSKQKAAHPFGNEVKRCWNKLLPEVVDSASEEIFKRRLDGVWDTLFVP